ncbi:hypothetical protein SBOR_8757 [Sclerotinia borealis F-4128]|uniref:Uncharacterized protein n=1 Tax=Sclerotinia borealis (strain F-4128) TaxID=1432307 RepID=W9C8J7_SCLBF|nr:hypothetical protein SBOR_8757 [Sclerotinia borealis F-4128]
MVSVKQKFLVLFGLFMRRFSPCCYTLNSPAPYSLEILSDDKSHNESFLWGCSDRGRKRLCAFKFEEMDGSSWATSEISITAADYSDQEILLFGLTTGNGDNLIIIPPEWPIVSPVLYEPVLDVGVFTFDDDNILRRIENDKISIPNKSSYPTPNWYICPSLADRAVYLLNWLLDPVSTPYHECIKVEVKRTFSLNAPVVAFAGLMKRARDEL